MLYEVITKEFLAHKERYVADVLAILEKRAADEARLIFRRKAEPGCTQLWTEISAALSQEINAHYARLFAYFQQHPPLCDAPLFRRALEAHLPRLLRENSRYRNNFV